MANPVKIKSTLTRITDHGEDVYTLYFKPQKKLPRFKMGQFLHLALDEYNPQGGFWPESRIFSIASGPSSEEIVLAYSVKGVFTKRMKEELSAGREIWLKLPYGSFIIESSIRQEETVVLIAGGTGITPFVSYLCEKAQNDPDREITLFYGVRRPELFLFKDILSNCLAKMPNFRLYLFAEKKLPDGFSGLQAEVRQGRLSADIIREVSFRVAHPVYFLSGPPVMLKLFREDLLSAGIESSKIIIDEWE